MLCNAEVGVGVFSQRGRLSKFSNRGLSWGWLKEHKAIKEIPPTEYDCLDVILNVLDNEGNIDGRDSDTSNKATCLANFYKEIYFDVSCRVCSVVLRYPVIQRIPPYSLLWMSKHDFFRW
ncbi:hypothetical protein LINPERPRIM_LOCUS10940 [Linum perenne]